MLLLMGIPMFVWGAAFAIDFGATYYQRMEYYNAANQAVTAAGEAFAGASNGNGPCGEGGVIGFNGAPYSFSASSPQSCGAQVGDQTLAANIEHDQLPVPTGALDVTFVPAGTSNPCSPSTTVKQASYSVEFGARTSGLGFSNLAFGIGTIHYQVCVVSAVANVQ
jgi:hypothetical protein